MLTIKKLIENYLQENKLRKVDIIRTMPYKNEAKALRRLQNLLDNNQYDERFLTLLSAATAIDMTIIKQAIKNSETIRRKKQKQEMRERFAPHIWLLHENERPSSLLPLMVAGIKRYKYIELPDGIKSLSLWEQIERVKEIFYDYYEENKNKYSPFGQITGYCYFYAFEEYVKLSINGNIIGYFTGSVARGQFTLSIDKKTRRGKLPMG